ncbi:Exosome complex exonuclease rrp45-like protein, partial [Globisporangium splendens]
MAIREEHDFLSENERKFLFDSIHDAPHVRADGRELMQQRKVRDLAHSELQETRPVLARHLHHAHGFVIIVAFAVDPGAIPPNGGAESSGGTAGTNTFPFERVIANVHGEIVPPFPDRPTEGFLHFNVELSPMASQNFEVGRPSPMAVELARIVDRGIRECRALDTEALAIIAGEKVWAITCNIHIVDHGGNLIDCVSLAAIAAMMHYRRPEVSVQNNSTVVYNIDEHAAVPLSLHHIPISISFCFIESRDQGEPIIFMDPTDREERITDGSMTFTFNSFRELCAVHKIGGAAISTTEVLRCANVAAARVSELTEILKEEAEKADKIAIDQRRAFLRGRDFADVSSLSTLSSATQNRTEVDLGEMTDFKTLHAPIALRDDPTQEENDAKVTSMAQLLESLEVAAGITDNEAASSVSSGFEMSAEARDEFKKLTESRSVRDLVAGAKPSSSSSPVPSKPSPSTAKVEAKTMKQKKKKVEDSDSEEESVVVQSEFGGSAVAPAAKPALAPVKETKKPAKKTKKKAVSSDDDSEEEQDLSTAIKRKPRK